MESLLAVLASVAAGLLLWIDAPSPRCPPPYHALHHVFPDAYFSACTALPAVRSHLAAALASR